MQTRARGRSRGAATVRLATFQLICLLSASLFLKSFVVQLYTVPSESMEPTLLIGDRIAVTRQLTQWHAPRRGDVVVFRDPGGWLPPTRPPDSAAAHFFMFIGLIPYHSGEHLVKRVVGQAGDLVECRGPGPVYVNRRPLVEPYLAPRAQPCTDRFRVTVPARSIWVLGDNRDVSADSRFHLDDPRRGSVPLTRVVGTVQVRVWPPARWGPAG